MSKKVLIGGAWPYANSSLHLGHLAALISGDFLKRYLKKHPFLKTFVLGISGGQDSTLAGRLAQLAMEEMRAETGDASYQFIAVRLPYGVQADEADAQKALAFIQPDVSLVVNIKESADEMVRAVEATGTEVSDFVPMK